MRRAAAWAFWGLCLSLAACGYRTLRNVQVTHGLSRLQLVPFDESRSVGLAAAVGQELGRLLVADGVELALRPQLGAAAPGTARLRGSLDVQTLPSASRAGIAAYQLAATLVVRLEAADGSLLRSGTVAVQEDFLPQPDVDVQPLFTERNRRFAMARLAERAARAVHRLLQDGEG